jgi:hypothetical protein
VIQAPVSQQAGASTNIIFLVLENIPKLYCWFENIPKLDFWHENFYI